MSRINHTSDTIEIVTVNNKTSGFKVRATSNLAMAIAATLSGYLISATPVQAAVNIPTDSAPSPLCIAGACATEFTAKMLMFEEFGTKDISSATSSMSTHSGFTTTDCFGNVDGPALDKFLSEDLASLPSRRSDEDDNHIPATATNPWENKVKSCVPATVSLPSMPLDGRPGGEDFAHQRWSEFPTQVAFQSAQAGARVNGGLRDKRQLHGYKKGSEFGPNGLYYIDANGDGIPGTAGAQIKIHPNLPVQKPQSVWTFDGTLPPKLLMAKYGEAVLFRHYNALPLDPGSNGGFGKNTITTHEHNGHNPAESDGFAHAYIYPGQFYDYHWPMQLAGYDSINTDKSDARTGAPDGNGGITRVRGDWHETMSTHWFHDHMLDYTAQNVYKGNAAMMNYYSAIDRGREPADAQDVLGRPDLQGVPQKPGYGCHYNNPNNANLCLPSGSGLDWGNRDYDVNLVVADKAWDNTGQLKFNIFNTDGFLGDRATVNWEYKPFLDVRARSYRFRILNGSVSRFFKLALVRERPLTDAQCVAAAKAKGVLGATIVAPARPATSVTPAEPSKCYEKITYHMIANDGNIMQHAIPFPNAASPDALPEQSIAERFDIIVNFAGMPAGTKLYMVNILEHTTGAGPARYLPLADVLGTKYKNDGVNGDPVVGKIMEFRVQNYTGTDFSMKPADYEEGKKQMIPLNRPTQTELKAAVQRTFNFGKKAVADTQPWTIETDSTGVALNADPHRISAAPTTGATEIWHIKGGTGGWSHPVHVHFEEGQILYRNGVAPPIWEKYARKDVYRIGALADTGGSVDVAIRFREFAGTYVEHCHNTQHEDKAMLLRWDLQNPGQTQAINTPMPDWDGVKYDPSTYLSTAKFGDLAAKKKFVLPAGLLP